MDGQAEKLPPEENPRIKIQSVFYHDRKLMPAINSLLKQLSRTVEPLNDEDWYDLTTKQEHVVTFIIKDFLNQKEEEILGTATIFLIRLPSGWIGEIHDVIVDSAFQKQGFGRMLTKHIFGYVAGMAEKFKQPIRLSLTSKPERKLANAMYVRYGFELMAEAVPELDPTTGEVMIDPNTNTTLYKGTNLYRKTIYP